MMGFQSRLRIMQHLCALIGAAGAASLCPARQAPRNDNRPDAARRVVRIFEFEEKETNPTPVPQYWFRAQDGMVFGGASDDTAEPRERPGFPSWNLAELDYTSPAASGFGSVKLPTRGGSASLVTESGVIPVFQNADYSITAKIRTQGLNVARARLVARFLDGAHARIDGAEVFGEFINGPLWQTTVVQLVGVHEHAAFIELELQLLQPAHQGLKVRDYEALPQDLSGAAWFDSIAIAQLPRIELTTNGSGNVIASPDLPELRLDVRDLTGESLRGQVTIVDASGAIADRFVHNVGAGRAKEPWRPRLTRYGWYRAVLGVYNDQGIVGRATADFIWLPETPPIGAARADALAQRRSFGLVVAEDRPELVPNLPDIVRKVGSGSLIYPVWKEDLSRAEVAATLKRAAISLDPMLDAGQDIIFSLARVPSDLADQIRIDPDDPWPVLVRHADAAAPYLEPWLEKYGQRVRRWQTGAAADDRAFWRPTLPADIDTFEDSLSKLVPGPVIALPWSIERGLTKDVFATRARQTYVSALVPQDAGPNAIELFARDWQAQFESAGAPELGLVLEPIPANRYGYLTPSSELVKRAVEFWAYLGPGAPNDAGRGASGRPAGAWLLNPWDFSDERRPKLMPRPELAAWSNLVRQIADRQVVGTFPVTPGVRAYILAPLSNAAEGRLGAIVAWNESALADRATLRGHLAPLGGATVVDIFGNTSPAPTETSTTPNTTAIASLAVPLSDVPIFIDGIDASLARFIASVRIEPRMLQATNANHEHSIVFDNPWPTSIDVRTSLKHPGGFESESGAKDRRWRIAPRNGRATVAAGQTGRVPMTISFSPSEEGGSKDFAFDIELAADRPYGVIRVTTPIELGLDDIKLELTSLPAGPNDALIEAQITNLRKVPATVELTALAPGLPKVKSQVSDLPPGGQAIRRFPYGGSLQVLRGKKVFIALTDPASGARLNRSVEIH